MAGNNLRSSRRDPLARDAEPALGGSAADPLAELARLIGQSDAYGAPGRPGGEPAEYSADATPLPELDWAATDEGYGRQGEQAHESYGVDRLSDAGNASWPAADETHVEPPIVGQYPPPGTMRDNSRHVSGLDALFSEGSRDVAVPRAQSLPYVSPAHVTGASVDQFDSQAPVLDDAGEQYDKLASTSRRGTAILALSVLGLVVLGTAGAFGYRAMFGRSMIPSLPPIIKPADTPIKIVPKHDSQAAATNQKAAAAKGGPEQLVSHEEKPVNIQAANPAVPRVVTTIPVISNAPSALPPPAQSPAPSQPPSAAVQSRAASPQAPPATAGHGNAAQSFASVDQLIGPTTAEPPSGSKPVHTVVIRPDQPAPKPATAAPASTAHAVPVRRPPARTAREQPATRTASAGPLSLVPGREGRAVQAQRHERTAMTRRSTPMSLASSEAAPARRGGYAVQISSRRSEAEAQAAFRSLQAKYPQQLGGRHEYIRRADLGAKGVYYRALVGPFASAQEAATLCSKLKAAGGGCLIQRN